MARPTDDELKSLATLFDTHLKTKDARGKFKADPKGSTKALKLPRNVVDHLGKLSPDELALMSDTYEEMKKGNLTEDVGGVKVTFF